MPRQRKERITRRYPELVDGFGKRLREALLSLGVSQQELAETLGGYRPDAISFLVKGKSSQIAIDLVIRLGEFMYFHGVSLPWLFMGLGEMMLADELADIGPKVAVEDILSYAMLVAIGKKMGFDLQAIAAAWQLEVKWPGRGAFILPIYSLADKIEQVIPGYNQLGSQPKITVPRHVKGAATGPATAGYRTISAEDVPTSPDWWKSYVPVIGRVAAGEGMDTIEASQYPPAWAGEFVEFRGGSPTAVAVRVAGESMLPTYSQDDMLIVDTAQQAESGQVCCVLVAVAGFREARVKRLIRRGKIFLLESLNPAWSPDIIEAEKIIAAYAIVAHLPRLSR